MIAPAPSEFIHKWTPGTASFTLVLMHGTGGDENDLLPVGRAIAPGANLLSPRGKVSEQGANRFFARSAHGRFDPGEITSRAEEFARWLKEASAQYRFDPDRMYALGYSNGANMAWVTMLLHPGSIAGGVLLRPMMVIRPETLPDLHEAPVLISAGMHDPLLPAGDTEALAELLTRANASVEIARHQSGHELTPDDFSLAKHWLSKRQV